MIKVNTLEEYANLNVLKTYCKNMSDQECQECAFAGLCNFLTIAPEYMEIEYVPEKGDETDGC